MTSDVRSNCEFDLKQTEIATEVQLFKVNKFFMKHPVYAHLDQKIRVQSLEQILIESDHRDHRRNEN